MLLPIPINHPYKDATHISIVASPLALFCRIVLPALHFLNNLHVEFSAILLIINSLRGYMKVRLPILSCNLSLTFLANMLCISVLDDTRRARLFNFSLSAIPKLYWKLFVQLLSCGENVKLYELLS